MGKLAIARHVYMSFSTFLFDGIALENVESLNIPQTPKMIDYIKNEVSSIIMLCKNIKIWFIGRSGCEAQSYVYTRYTICIPCLVFLFSASNPCPFWRSKSNFCCSFNLRFSKNG